MCNHLRRVGLRLFGVVALLSAITAKAVDTYEAEAARLTGNLRVESTVTPFSGAGYVGGFQASSDNLYFETVTAPATGLYELTIGYRSPYGEKKSRIYVNGQVLGEVTLTQTEAFAPVAGGKVLLNQGANVIRIESNWGWYEIDYIQLAPAQRRPPSDVSKRLINPKATIETKSLISYLVDQFGKVIVSGQQSITDLPYIQAQTGRQPAILGLDFMDYSPSRVAYGTTSQATEEGIDWWANKKGIVTYCWHWNAPKGLLDTPSQRWWSGFYTSATTFDIAFAMNNPESEDYALILRDIDAIAVQLKRLQAANVPVLWRPLHEAEGGWFWWGAKGPEACKALWRLLYDRLTNQHGLHNLIWVWNSVDPDWYPGDSYVDIVSADSYPGRYNYTPQSATFDSLVELSSNQKLIAMTENGPIPEPELMKIYDATWSWFCSWNQSTSIDNTVAHIQKIFNDPFVITLDELPSIAQYPLTSFAEIRRRLRSLADTGDVGDHVIPVLSNKLKQAEHHTTKGHKAQAVRHLRDFKKQLTMEGHAADLSEKARTDLSAYADLLVEELSR